MCPSWATTPKEEKNETQKSPEWHVLLYHPAGRHHHAVVFHVTDEPAGNDHAFRADQEIESGKISEVNVAGYDDRSQSDKTATDPAKTYSKQISPMWMDDLYQRA